MKLLPKKQVQTLVEDQRKNQIDEGVMLARKVDALREKLADLQKQHSLFVMGMEDNLQEKTGKLFERIQGLETEIKLLEVKKAELRKPLDLEWQKLKTDKESLVAKTSEIEGVLSQIRGKEERIGKRDTESKEKLNHIKIRERELERTFDKADQLRVEAEKVFLQKNNEKEKQDKEFSERSSKLDIAESAIKSFQFTLLQRQGQIEMREKENEAEKIRLVDMRKTLERSLARLKTK